MRAAANPSIMTLGRVLGGFVLAAFLLAPAGAEPRRNPTIIVVPGSQPALPVVPYGQPLSCWFDVRIFRTLRNGNFPYCRQNLRYRPGALECFQVTEQVCEVVLPGAFLPIQATSPVNRQVIPCPDGPEPPVCRRLDIQ